ncbi:MAG TPA: YihY/virulence factor BrkB family protein [Actinomycetes bacterium]|nr:YihY/virulence factor BrkB family protein [Actinomycetes bacterium]
MTRAARKGRKRPGLTRRMAGWTMQLGMLATAVLVGRRTAGGGKATGDSRARSGGSAGTPGLGAAAGVGPSAAASHETDPDAVTDNQRGRRAERPQEIPAKGWKDIAKRTMKGVKQDQVPLLSAGVAFYTLLALFPAIIAGVSIYGLVADPETVRQQLDELTRMLSPETATLIGEQIKQITGGAGGALGVATGVGILTALWSASSGMKALITGVNLAYDESEGRTFLKLRGLALLLTLGAMVLMAVALTLIVAFPALTDSWPAVLRWTVGTLRWVLLAALLVAGLAVLYRYAPDRDEPKWTWVSWGSGIATLLWVLASVGFSIYANSFGNYNKTYGALAGVIILMFWLFLTAFVVLVGAELNTEMELQTAKDTTTGPGRPMGEREAHAADHVAESPPPSR